MIVVTGATGNVGSRLVSVLAREGASFRVGARSPDKARAQLAGAGSVVRLDLDDPSTFVPALQGADHLFFLPPMVPHLPQIGAALVEAARQAGIEHIVKLSAFGCEHEPGIQLGRWHREVERQIEASGIGWTHLRPNNFMENLIGYSRESIRRESKIYQPLGEGAVSYVAVDDIAEVAARTLLDPGHAGKAYALTGPKAHTVGELAAVLGRVLGKPITYVDVPEEAARQAMAGAPGWLVEALMELNAIDKAGYAAGVTQDVERVLGRPATSFEAWAERNAASFN